MPNHQILNFDDHAAVRVHTAAGADLGDAVMACLVVPPEFRRLATHYPILFRQDAETGQFSALALFGFEPDENLFLNGDQWDAGTKPLAMAVQPFLVGRSRDPEAPGQVHIDMDHPRIARDETGVRLFEPGGQPTLLVEEVADMLGALDQGYRDSAAFYAALERHDLLEPFSMDVTLDDGSQNRLVGYHLINEERLSQLAAGALAELHGDGHLLPIFMAVASVGNLSALVRRRNRRPHG
jgi:hypothetical protein